MCGYKCVTVEYACKCVRSESEVCVCVGKCARGGSRVFTCKCVRWEWCVLMYVWEWSVCV